MVVVLVVVYCSSTECDIPNAYRPRSSDSHCHSLCRVAALPRKSLKKVSISAGPGKSLETEEFWNLMEKVLESP